MKRTLVLICVLAICLSFAAIPAFAAEVAHYSLTQVSGDYMSGVFFGSPFSVPGTYSADVVFRFNDSEILPIAVSSVPVTFSLTVAESGAFVYEATSASFPIDLEGLIVDAYLHFILRTELDIYALAVACFLSLDGEAVSLAPDLLEVTLSTPDSAMENVNGGLNAVLLWIGLLCEELMGGKLSALLKVLAVGISVSVVFMSIRTIRKYSWGM